MIIRKANITDVFELSRLWSYMVKEADSTLTPNLEMWRAYIVDLMKYSGYFPFLAETDDKIIGMIDYAASPNPGKNAWMAVINFFYVLPEHRGEVSGKLWATLIESAKQNNLTEMYSTCFVEKLDFWKRHGFKEEAFMIRREL
jgi:GNAT superfamily N-acetyltransferase